jgi:two-component system, NtrC family, sensor kinase
MPDAPKPGNLDVADFTVGAMLRAGIAIRRVVRGADSLEDAAGLIVRYLYEHCVDPLTGERSCALVRFYKTHPFGGLDQALRDFAAAQLGDHPPDDAMRCLTLMATAGDEPAWNSRHQSAGHRAIPLPSAERIRSAPMIMRLMDDLGIDIERIVAGAEPSTRGPDARTYDVFHVEEALGSPYIPAQRGFVVPHRIASVVGFGGLLRSGELFTVILFSRVPVPARSAARFRAIALDVRSSLFNFDDSNTWQA